MAYVSLSDDETKVVGIFNMPQNLPQPQGYTVISDDDSRLQEYLELNSEFLTTTPE